MGDHNMPYLSFAAEYNTEKAFFSSFFLPLKYSKGSLSFVLAQMSTLQQLFAAMIDFVGSLSWQYETGLFFCCPSPSFPISGNLFLELAEAFFVMLESQLQAIFDCQMKYGFNFFIFTHVL